MTTEANETSANIHGDYIADLVKRAERLSGREFLRAMGRVGVIADALVAYDELVMLTDEQQQSFQESERVHLAGVTELPSREVNDSLADQSEDVASPVDEDAEKETHSPMADITDERVEQQSLPVDSEDAQAESVVEKKSKATDRSAEFEKIYAMMIDNPGKLFMIPELVMYAFPEVSKAAMYSRANEFRRFMEQEHPDALQQQGSRSSLRFWVGEKGTNTDTADELTQPDQVENEHDPLRDEPSEESLASSEQAVPPASRNRESRTTPLSPTGAKVFQARKENDVPHSTETQTAEVAYKPDTLYVDRAKNRIIFNGKSRVAGRPGIDIVDALHTKGEVEFKTLYDMLQAEGFRLDISTYNRALIAINDLFKAIGCDYFRDEKVMGKDGLVRLISLKKNS